ncbi:MAG: aminopeptidase N [Venatoribacter sp.]
MRDANPKAIYLTEYTQPNYWINTTELFFDLQDQYTLVKSRLAMVRNDSAKEGAPLTLAGSELELLSVAVDGQLLSPSDYQQDDESLTLSGLPQAFSLEIEVKIYPDQNTALEGLYRSGGMYCTQCEAEGFRRITYFLDRPDVMSIYTTHIRANAKKYPVLLSNGNLIADSTEGEVRSVTWHDPHKKPSYLFALVAGDLLVKEDQFTTMNGRNVALKLFVEPQNIDKTDYALDALKRAMKWDEDTYGREYDLDIFMIVAVDDFNMGAMENKGLNVFNSSCVLANPKTATDANYQRVEGVVAHEYFHNWSGNRVTCRDWFQLSLKEGFTVFRDASFSADMNSATVKRIEDATLLRTAQFAEDAGPMAHPVQPDSFIEISNFYTMTIYEKGAEVVRMIHKIVGKEGFRKGSDLYFARHDGQAVTINEFVAAMENANDIDLTLFKRWYKQAGTPVVTASYQYDSDAKQFILELSQCCPDTPGQSNKLPMWIPLQVGLLNSQGQDMCLEVEPASAFSPQSQVLHLTEATQRFVFNQVNERPVLSLLRDFSAPIKLELEQSQDDLLFLLAHDSDGFNRFEAGQRLMLSWINQALEGKFELSSQAQAALAGLLQNTELDEAMLAYLLKLPSEAFVLETKAQANPVAIHKARESVRLAIANALVQEFKACYQRLDIKQSYIPEHSQMAKRALKNLALSYWLAASEEGAVAAKQQYQNADNMTDQMAALAALVNSQHHALAQELLASFYQQWQHEPLVVNQWLSVQASSAQLGTVEHVKALLEHPAFDWRNPNKIRSVVGAFAAQSLVNFHSQAGYELLADAIIRLNKANPQIASRMLNPLTRHKRLVPELSALMHAQLERIMAKGDLSKDVYEVVSKSLS